MILTVGGTGLGPKDLTVETLQPLLKREIHGLMEASRSFGQKRTPYAALSRGVAGYIDNSLVMTLPGSRQGAKESLIAVLPALVHLFDVQKIFHIKAVINNVWMRSRPWSDYSRSGFRIDFAAYLQLATERLKLNQALNRYLAEDIYSGINLPLFSQSAVDGYALCTQAAIEPESEFQLIGEIRAGQQDELQLQDGQAVRILPALKFRLGLLRSHVRKSFKQLIYPESKLRNSLKFMPIFGMWAKKFQSGNYWPIKVSSCQSVQLPL